jgi:hypothetical protein
MVGVLLVFYRPTVEYAYIDVTDFRDSQSPGIGGTIIALAGALLVVIGTSVAIIVRRSRRTR